MTSTATRPHTHANGMPTKLLKPAEVCEIIGIHRRTLNKWIAVGRFPKADHTITNRTVRWHVETVLEWMEANPS
ncbi:MAG: helix-turn-helix transcriptional regulator [Gemmataceae bacterium]